MNELRDVAKAGGKNMTIFGVIAIILGMLAMLAPGLTGMSVIIMLGVLNGLYELPMPILSLELLSIERRD